MLRFASAWPVLTLVIIGLLASEARSADKPRYPAFGTIVRKDPRLDKLVPKDAKMEQLAEGFDWSEGPTWVKEGG